MQKLLVVGATGLVGNSFARQAAKRGNLDVHILARRTSDFATGITQHIADTDDWPQQIAAFAPDIVFCGLGTTIKQAGSKAAFCAVDLELVQTVAAASKNSGAKHFISISSGMANADASSFYLKTKGQAERALRALQFERLDIIRPGLLRGNRSGPLRLGESLAIMISPVTDLFLHGRMEKFRSVHADDVAAAALALTDAHEDGVFIHENPDISALGGK